MITTSHCSLHLFSDTNEIYFDLYSCRDFDSDIVVSLLDKTFGIKEWHGMLYRRATNAEPLFQEIGSGKTKEVLKITAEE